MHGTNACYVWLNLENIMVSKGSQTQKTTYYMVCLSEMSRIGSGSQGLRGMEADC